MSQQGEKMAEMGEPIPYQLSVTSTETGARLVEMVADVISMHPRDRDSNSHVASECPTAKAVIENLSRVSALRALVEQAPDHPRKPVLP